MKCTTFLTLTCVDSTITCSQWLKFRVKSFLIGYSTWLNECFFLPYSRLVFISVSNISHESKSLLGSSKCLLRKKSLWCWIPIKIISSLLLFSDLHSSEKLAHFFSHIPCTITRIKNNISYNLISSYWSLLVIYVHLHSRIPTLIFFDAKNNIERVFSAVSCSSWRVFTLSEDWHP